MQMIRQCFEMNTMYLRHNLIIQ